MSSTGIQESGGAGAAWTAGSVPGGLRWSTLVATKTVMASEPAPISRNVERLTIRLSVQPGRSCNLPAGRHHTIETPHSGRYVH